METGTLLAIHSLLLGIKLTLIYDGLRVLRGLIKHKLIFVALEDLAYWVYVFIESFIMLYHKNNGSLRWFAVAGAFLGMALCNLIISDILVKTVVIILSRIFGIIYKIYVFIIRPVKLLIDHMKKAAKGLADRIIEFKKKLKNHRIVKAVKKRCDSKRNL